MLWVAMWGRSRYMLEHGVGNNTAQLGNPLWLPSDQVLRPFPVGLTPLPEVYEGICPVNDCSGLVIL